MEGLESFKVSNLFLFRIFVCKLYMFFNELIKFIQYIYIVIFRMEIFSKSFQIFERTNEIVF